MESNCPFAKSKILENADETKPSMFGGYPSKKGVSDAPVSHLQSDHFLFYISQK